MSAAVAVGLVVAACGGSPQNADQPTGKFTVEIPTAKFPASQIITQQTHLVITVHNPGPKTIPDPAVTICNVSCGPATGKWHAPPQGEGTSVLPFAVLNHAPNVANPSKQVWIIDHNPNPTPCVNGAPHNASYNCASGGPGGDVSEDSNTWALGHPLKPGGDATFDWAVTAVQPGRYTIAWEVAAGLFGGAKAVLSNGTIPQGTFTVSIGSKPQQSYVNNNGQIVQTNQPVPPPQGLNGQ